LHDPVLRRRLWPSPCSDGLGALDSPSIHFRWAHLFGACTIRVRYDLMAGSPPCVDPTRLRRPTETCTPRLPSARSPSPTLGMTTVVTGQFHRQDSHLLERQLASLHQNWNGSAGWERMRTHGPLPLMAAGRCHSHFHSCSVFPCSSFLVPQRLGSCRRTGWLPPISSRASRTSASSGRSRRCPRTCRGPCRRARASGEGSRRLPDSPSYPSDWRSARTCLRA